MTNRPHLVADGSLDLGNGVVIPARELRIRATTSGGPGGQHANRTLSRIVVHFDVSRSTALSEAERTQIIDRLGPNVTTSSSSSRSQFQNRARALHVLAERLASALEKDTPRRASRPTKSSIVRRLDDKKRHSQLKSSRRVADD